MTVERDEDTVNVETAMRFVANGKGERRRVRFNRVRKFQAILTRGKQVLRHILIASVNLTVVSHNP